MERINNKKHLSLALRGAIVGQFKTGMTYSQIGGSLNVSKQTVGRWVGRYVNENTIDRRPQPGAPQKLNFQTRANVVQQIIADPFTNGAIVGRQYQVNKNTIRRYWKEAGILHGIAAKKPALSPAQMQARLNFAHANINRDWSRVIFSDEKTYQSDQHQKLHVYRPRNSRYNPRYVQPNQRSGRLTAGIWGWICEGGAGEMCMISRRLNRFTYVEILEDVLLPSLNIMYPNERMVFMQDNCSVHTAHIVQDWFQDHHLEIELLRNWPANSPDLNPIENFWSATTREWKNVFPRNRENLENAIIDRWEAHRGNSQYFDRLYASMPTRLQEVINNNGGATSY